MKTAKYLLIALGALAFSVSAQTNKAYHISDMQISRDNNRLNLAMTVNLADYGLKYNQQLELIPVIRSLETTDTIALPPYIVAGKNTYRYTERSGRPVDHLLRSGANEPFVYEAQTDWQPWMDHCRLDFVVKNTGCCGVATAPDKNTEIALIDYRPLEYKPVFSYTVPAVETEKTRRLEGRAYVSFHVNKIDIDPGYMINPQELAKITASIDTVRNNADATVTSITMTGYASPEGPYDNNVYLADGRVKAVAAYVLSQRSFPSEIMHTASVPEDWAGLRDSVAVSILPDRNEILAFIDEETPIRTRNDELRRRFPTSYAYLLKNVYPWLRHTNYAIDYTIRTFTDPAECLRVFKERPQNLSLNEFFLAASNYPVGSPEYDNVFDVAAIYYPNNDVANLNAANSSMNEGDLKRARVLLNRVSDDLPTSLNAKAALEALEGNYDAAEELFTRARESGIAEADANLEQIRRVKAGRHHITFLPEQ